MSVISSVTSAAGKVGSVIGTGVKAVGRGVVLAGKSVVSTAGKVGKAVGSGVTKVGKTVGSVGSKVGKTIGSGASKVKMVSSPKTFRVAGGGKLIRGHNSVTGKPTVRIQKPSSGSSTGRASAVSKQRTFRLMSSEQAAKFSGSRSARISHASAPQKPSVKFDPKPGSKFRIKSTRSADGVSSSRLVVDRHTGELLQMTRSPDPVTGKSVVKLKKPTSNAIAKLQQSMGNGSSGSGSASYGGGSSGEMIIVDDEEEKNRSLMPPWMTNLLRGEGELIGAGLGGFVTGLTTGLQPVDRKPGKDKRPKDSKPEKDKRPKDPKPEKDKRPKNPKSRKNEIPGDDSPPVIAQPSVPSYPVASVGPYYRNPKHESHYMKIEGLSFNIRGRNELTDREHQFINEQRDKTHRHKQEQFAWEQAPKDRDAERHWNLVNTGKLLYKDGKVTSDPAVIAAELERDRREERLERDFERKWLNKRRNPILRKRSPEAQERAKANLYHKMRKESESAAFWSAVAKNSAKKRSDRRSH